MQSRKEFFEAISQSRLKAMEDCFYSWRTAATGVDDITEDQVDCLFAEFLSLATMVHHYNRSIPSPHKAILELADPRGTNKSLDRFRAPPIPMAGPETAASCCDDCTELRKLAEGQNRVIASLASSQKTSVDLVETMSKVIFQEPGPEKAMSTRSYKECILRVQLDKARIVLREVRKELVRTLTLEGEEKDKAIQDACDVIERHAGTAEEQVPKPDTAAGKYTHVTCPSGFLMRDDLGLSRGHLERLMSLLVETGDTKLKEICTRPLPGNDPVAEEEEKADEGQSGRN